MADFATIAYVYVNVSDTLGDMPLAQQTTEPSRIDPALERTWTIAQLADEYDVTLRTIRHYEDLGLIAPERRGTTRVFHVRDRVRLALILRGKRLGFTLDEIAAIVDMYDAEPGEAGQLTYLIGQIGVRRADLEQRRRDLDQTLVDLDHVEQRCREDLARLAADQGM
jgi:DNA-binding transcriptional MerR regulator